MGFNWKELSKVFDEVNINEYFDKVEGKNTIRNCRFDKFTEWLKHNDFDSLIYKIILKHGDSYKEKAYLNGCEFHANNVLSFIIEYAVIYGEEVQVKELDSMFSTYIIEFKGYYFQKFDAQGTVFSIYNKEDKRLLI